jgi:Ricin-type beta-trefoil lectin domain-like
VLTQNWQASRGVAHDSDHWPVAFSSLRAGAHPTRFTISDHGNSSVLDVYDAQQANGTRVILYRPDSGTDQLWTLKAAGL